MATPSKTGMIEHAVLRSLAESGKAKRVNLIGQPGGWIVEIQSEDQPERRCLMKRRGEVRVFKKIGTATEYLQKLNIRRFEVDSANFEPAKAERADVAERMKKTHKTAGWLERQMEEALAEADSPDARWLPHEDVKQRLAARRARRTASDADKAGEA